MTDPKDIAVVFKFMKINRRKAKKLRKALEDLIDYTETHPSLMHGIYNQMLAEDSRSELMSYDEYMSFIRKMLAAAHIVEEPWA